MFSAIGQVRYWSDIPESRLWRYHQEHGLQLFRDPAAKPNGNCFYNGYLVTCEHETRRVTLTDLDESSPSPKRVGRSEAVVWQFEGKKLNPGFKCRSLFFLYFSIFYITCMFPELRTTLTMPF